MTESFGIPQLTEYLTRMGLKMARIDREQELIELAFHSSHGQWRVIVGIQQSGDAKKLMLIAPHIGIVTLKKRLECLEALMAVNYRIAIGKFGLDLIDGEVRLEETIPLANNAITFEQFQLAFGAVMQTVAIYQDLLPRIVYKDMSVQDALNACEHDFFETSSQIPSPAQSLMISSEQRIEGRPTELDDLSELDVEDVLAEVVRLLEGPKE
jgi:hypothetical protein